MEIADNLASVVAVRDSKDAAGQVLIFGPDRWRTLVGGVKGSPFRA